MKLFAPYWRTIAVNVVQDLNRRPQIAQQISDLLAMSVSDFLSMTQVYTVPVFVLTKRQDVLQRIANACGVSIMVLCREHNNLAAILSCVLLKTPSDAESLIMNLLNAVSPEFSNVDCAELLKSEPQATASELLRAAGENKEAETSKVSTRPLPWASALISSRLIRPSIFSRASLTASQHPAVGQLERWMRSVHSLRLMFLALWPVLLTQ